MEDLVVLAISMITLGQIGFCLPQLLSRAFNTHTYFPLAVFFFANGIIASGPAVFLLMPAWSTLYIAAIFPACLLLGPALWLYVEGLTSARYWHMQPKHAVQFIPFILGLIVSGLIMGLPKEVHQSIFNDGANIDAGFPLVVVVCIFLTMLLWAVQSGYYVIRIIIRLSKYRKQLKNLFASNEQRELGWLGWVLTIIAGSWLLFFASLMSTLVQDNSLFGYRAGTTLLLILVWTMAYWGLRQKPGFEGRYTDDKPEISPPEILDSEKNKKYQRSALSKEQALRIADKINAAMELENLHLDPSLSLHKLAQHVAIPPNYISQTLNETMETNFFDFVNKWRIKTAKPKIIANKETVLHIALEVGFNARSSFYKVFKKETGKTPSEFRKSHHAQTKTFED
ncbi:helix-turn-helix domain-containing protein [Litorilituus lipolyticus]|uniref:Helix-turn-helix domain-containing protein n=1 Tax=Litorilituus lipolyticus TaxID=2491017 RepID=A0A502KPI9_9GAMM|nr:AraC family transcriptional regulator [Litorilituus lipolyticus]TPH13416.1 helix-turn-helix domain-containing protein [Litorilituus lipolyticus]